MKFDTAKKKKKVIYEPVKLEQNYRNFDFESPWEGTNYIKKSNKKIKMTKKTKSSKFKLWTSTPSSSWCL